MNPRRATMLSAQFKKATAVPDKCVKLCVDETDMNKWYVIISNISGDDNEYVGGEYLIRIKLPDDYPFNPPEFYLMTPNGVYAPEVKVCVSIGEFHKKDYRAVLGVYGFCANLMSGIVGYKTLGNGISIIHTTVEQKIKFAKASVKYNNEHHAEIVAAVNKSYDEYEEAYIQKQIAAASTK